jgi:PAS domain-containing protein
MSEAGSGDAAPAPDRVDAILDGVFDPYLVLETVRDGAGTIVDFRIVSANQAACAGLGVERGSVGDARLLELLTDDERRMLPPWYARVVETGEPLAADITFFFPLGASSVLAGAGIHRSTSVSRTRRPRP